MEKRVLFRSAWLPWVLLLPQLVVISVFVIQLYVRGTLGKDAPVPGA